MAALRAGGLRVRVEPLRPALCAGASPPPVVIAHSVAAGLLLLLSRPLHGCAVVVLAAPGTETDRGAVGAWIARAADGVVDPAGSDIPGTMAEAAERRGDDRLYDAVKRCADILGAGLGLLLASPVVAGGALAVRLSLGSPVFFRQVRAGRRGRPFEILKLRTMRTEEEAGHNNDEPRLTPLGRALRAASIDELPALWNVLRGDMSLVGPRPLPLRYVGRYTREQARRLDVRPGLTGLAQVRGRNAISWEERFEKDVRYVRSRSLLLDLRILLETPMKVLARADVAPPDDGTGRRSTMPELTGSGGAPPSLPAVQPP